MAADRISDLGDLIAHYDRLVAMGKLDADPAQRRVALYLARLQAELTNLRFATKSSSLGWLFAKRDDANPVKGAYIHGGVGRGKTMLMDMFFEVAPDLPKRRLHFQEFMGETHDRIHAYRQKQKDLGRKADDPIVPVAVQIANEVRLLCFDEFQVSDITDAMILGRLFQALFARKVIVVATSNTSPDELYKDGLNRALFLPFIALMRERMAILHLDSRTDYRLDRLSAAGVYFTPADGVARRAMDALWQQLTGGMTAPAELAVKGRTLVVPAAGMGAARFSFTELCERPLGSADYLKLARDFHTLMVESIPSLGPEKRNEARRFINLVDALYDNRVKLIASAAAEPDGLYPEGDGADAFERTASRLSEMRSSAYLALPHGRDMSHDEEHSEQENA